MPEPEKAHTAVVQFSTGMASAEVAFRAVSEYAEVVLVTADTTIEDEDNWRFAREVHDALGEPEWVVLRDGRNPMQVGRDEKCVPNNRMAVCSRILKRELIRSYIEKRWEPNEIINLLGYDWTEPHRHAACIAPWQPYEVDSPLLRPPYWQKGDLTGWRATRGIEPPRLYLTGAPHANCGGGCVRGGQVEWRRLLFWDRDRYLWWEGEEEQTRAMLGKDVAIMRHRGGPLKGDPLTLREFRERLEVHPTLFDTNDRGACGCDPWTEPAAIGSHNGSPANGGDDA
jgi:hypothetical protein